MDINFSLEEAVRKRYSVRNYTDEKIKAEEQSFIRSFVSSLGNPFGQKVNFHYLDKKSTEDEKILGTYGVIKGASQYIGTTIKLEKMALESLGYEMETLILYLASLGIGTCWLGGTFNRKGFAKAMDIGEEEIFPIITPIGYAAEKKHIKEMAMRKMISADKRKKWEDLFFKDNFDISLDKKEAKDLEFPLKMLRLAPSASNKQPWRIVIKDDSCHFYEYKEPGYSDRFPYDIQRIDMGIAAAHFDLAMKEKNIKGSFNMENKPDIELPENVEYVFSWTRK